MSGFFKGKRALMKQWPGKWAAQVLLVSPDGGELTKTSQIRLCGNSVCPPVAAAIVSANLGGALSAEVA